ncbi:MAG: hypothetical protein MJ102_04675 [Clostridia bacterium]|nr:hypothetical protein [Clostridia bacterium]
MKTQSQTKTWRQYEAGKAWKRKLGLYSSVRENERFYRGDQWRGGNGLPHPVFNLVRRITDYLISTAAAGDIKIKYSDENLPFVRSADEAKAICEGIELLNCNAAYRWDHKNLSSLVYRLLTDAAISGDGFIYCWWDPDAPGGGNWNGDVVTEAVDSVSVFPADTTKPDIQSQDFIILSGKATVAALREEARCAGLPESDIARILPDGRIGADGFSSSPISGGTCAGELGDICPECDPEDSFATYLIKFWKENGKVVFEKSTRDCVLRRVVTPCTLYPIAHFSWYPAKDCFHGVSPVSGMIANQKYINRAYAMMMKHMSDTAFSKVIYDRTRIPEWTNEVGEAIAAVGGGDLADAVRVIEPGKLENGYLELIDSAVLSTKELAGATETALGNIDPTNTSAILALRETSRQSLDRVRSEFYDCLGQMAAIWADMTLAYCPDGRPLRTPDGFGRLNTTALRRALLNVRIDISDSSRYSASTTQALLSELLDNGHITFSEYLERLPQGLIPDKQGLIDSRRKNFDPIAAAEEKCDPVKENIKGGNHDE